ncbi:VOC family protein [Streptomyces sp. NPDC059590]|uniref:VOC family protein n=1 Tax=Streptomyces sp. NPDC059590 TaxID=3346877 RepID=UPI0036CC4E13
MSVEADIPSLVGVHHLKLPVRDLARSEAWYGRTLGYQRAAEFLEQGVLIEIVLSHPAGGPDLALRLDPDRAEAAAGFDYFAIAVPDGAAIEALAARLEALGEPHGGVWRGLRGWVLPSLHDPDGHEVRFYTMEEHTSHEPGEVMRMVDPLESAEQVRPAAP